MEGDLVSFKLMAQALDIKTGAPITKLILLKLCDNANDNGVCWPSQDLIAEQCETTRETVNRHIKKLTHMGLVELEHQSKKGAQTVNKYKINLGVTEDHSRCDGGSHLGVTEDHTEPIIEPINKKNIEKKVLAFCEEANTIWRNRGGENYMPVNVLQGFVDKWTEPLVKGRDKGKPSFMGPDSWSTAGRLATWRRNAISYGHMTETKEGRNNA